MFVLPILVKGRQLILAESYSGGAPAVSCEAPMTAEECPPWAGRG